MNKTNHKKGKMIKTRYRLNFDLIYGKDKKSKLKDKSQLEGAEK